jgi:catechol 2,3-dioxygenase-like lactoylglutathione lyase family enzyme
MSPPVETGPLNHVALPTADPERGARFYVDVLGFVVTPRPSFSFRGSWLLRRETGVMVHLLHYEAFKPDLEGDIFTQGRHVAFQVNDFDAATARLRAHGVDFRQRILPDYGYRQAFFRDPDGNVIELGEWPAPVEMFPESA